MSVVLRPLTWFVSVIIASLFVVQAASAHHSFAMFDFDKLNKATATVEEFRWTNPHVVLLIKKDASAGGEDAGKVWQLELTSPGNLTRTGWSRHSFTPGDKIEIEFHPLRDGRRGGAFKKATFPDGKTIESNLRVQEKPGLQ
jgi:hypothetical protein